MTDIPTTMKAWVADRPGPTREVLEFNTDWPTPSPPKPGEIMVKVSYVALNPGDAKMIAMKVPFIKVKGVVGFDFVGEVIQVGPSAATSPSDIGLGMIVAGTVPFFSILRGVGVLAEYAVVPAHAVVEKPAGVELSVAAALFGVVGQTNFVLLQAAGLHSGASSLVNGASGGVGCILVQILHGMGVHVTAVCSAKNEALVRRLGADEVIDYTAHKSLCDHLTSVATAPGGKAFDAIFDCVGNHTLYVRSPGYLKPDGKFLSIDGGPFSFIRNLKLNFWPAMLGGTPRTYTGVFSNPSGASAKGVAHLFEKGWIQEIPIDAIFELKDALQAFDKIATQRTVGKVLVKVN